MQGMQDRSNQPGTANHNNVRDEAGQALILLALSLVVLCGFLGLAIDVGQARTAQRHMQSVADAAALAGALEVSFCGGSANCTKLTSAAQQSAVENGLNNVALVQQCGSTPSSGQVLVVNNGPCSTASDPNYDNTNFVEVVATEDQPTIFARVFGLNTFRISARSEATIGNSPFCLYVADRPGTGGTFSMNQGGHLDASCAIDVGTGITVRNGVHIASTQFAVGGDVSGTSNQISPAPIANYAALSDPLTNLTPPNNPGGCTSLTVSKSQSISQGCYSSIDVKNGTLTLSPGLYYMTGNFTADHGTKVDGTSGVTFYFTTGTFNLDSGSTVNLSAPNKYTVTSSDYEGILMWEAVGNTTQFNLDSGSRSSWEGLMYLPSATMDISSGGNLDAKYTIIVVNSLVLDSGSHFTINNDYSSLDGGSPVKGVSAVLAE